MKKQLLILAGLVIFNTCFSQSNHANNQVLGGGNSSALDFDGVDDKVTTPIIFNSTTYTNWTIECWAKSPTGPGSALGFDGPMYGDNAGIIWHHGSGSFQGAGTVQAADLNYFSASFGTLLANTWYHLAVTYDGTLLKAYKNGTLMNTTTTSGGMANGAFPLVIGKHPTQGHHWEGSIDNPRVWTVARTCEQISETMNNVVISETGLVASYTFNDGVTNGSNTSLTAVQNAVTSTSDATLSGFALTGTSSNFVASAPFNLPPVCVTETASGQPANCLSFTAANDVVIVQNTVPLSDYTIECNVLLKDLTNQNIIVGTDASGTNVSVSHQLKLVNGQFVHYTYDGSLRTLASTATVNINQWYHVSIFVQANNVMGITVNGNTVYYPTSINTPWQLLSEFRLGGPAMGVADFNGKLDEVRIWDRMLCPSEIAHYSNCEVSFPTNGLRSVFHFNQGVDGANNAGINTLVAENSSVVGALLNFGLNGITSNWDDAGVIATGSACPTYTANCAATSLNFDGLNDYVYMPVNPILDIYDGTIEAWIKTNELSTNFKGIVAKINAYGMFLRNSRLGVYDWSTASETVVGNPLNDNQWHHVAFAFKNGVFNGSQLYVDGVATGSPFTYTILNQDNPLTIGNNLLTSNQYFKGNIDEVRVWNRELCPVEILSNKDCNAPSGASGLISVYHFDQGFDATNNVTVTSLLNSSGTGSTNGTLQNFSLSSNVSNWMGESPVSSTSCNSFYTGVTINGANIESVVSGGGITYQWYDCGTGNIISGETNMAYTPTVNGTYKVLVTVNGCEVMSDCITYSSVGLKNVVNMKNELLVYPNPAQDKLNVKADGKSLKVFNSLGVVVLTATLTKNETELDLTNLNSGVYYILTDLGATVKFVKQ